jgi:hypothetical protein
LLLHITAINSFYVEEILVLIILVKKLLNILVKTYLIVDLEKGFESGWKTFSSVTSSNAYNKLCC